MYPFHALDDPQPFVYSLASRPNAADGLVSSQWQLPCRSSSIADLISPHSPPKKKKKKKARNVVISYSYYSSRVFDNELL